jgi:Arc/MetJ-type ribon-helix-helix transcriptional regulator
MSGRAAHFMAAVLVGGDLVNRFDGAVEALAVVLADAAHLSSALAAGRCSPIGASAAVPAATWRRCEARSADCGATVLVAWLLIRGAQVDAYRSGYRVGMLCIVATEQIAVRLPVHLLAALDELVARGVYESRAAAARAGIETVLELDRRRLTDQAIIDGYQRVSPTQAEKEAAISSLRDAILEEPW